MRQTRLIVFLACSLFAGAILLAAILPSEIVQAGGTGKKGAYVLDYIEVHRGYDNLRADWKAKTLVPTNDETLKSPPIKYETGASTYFDSLKTVLTVNAPQSVAEGQEVTITASAVATYDLKEKNDSAQPSLSVRIGLPVGDTQTTPQKAPLGPGSYTAKASKTVTARIVSNNNVITLSEAKGVRWAKFGIDCRSGISVGCHLNVYYFYRYDPNATASTSSGTPPNPPNPPNPPGPSTAKCPPNIGGLWGLSVSGISKYQVNGNKVTGTVANLAGKYGLAAVTGTLNGKTMTGTWKSAAASGTITVTGPDDACMIWMTYTVTNPPGPGGTEGINLAPPSTGGPGGGTPGTGGVPWETAEGKNCFERWIALATKLINAADLGPTYSPLKPYSFNKYGLLVNKTTFSANAPDAWESHGRNKYWFIWDIYDTDATGGLWVEQMAPVFIKAGVPPLRDYVRQCAPGSTPGSTQEPPLGDAMILYAPNLLVPKGGQVLVPVELINAKDVLNLDFTLSYLTNIVSARGKPEKGNVISNIWESNLKQPGLFKFNFAQLSPFNGRGTVGGFRFDAIGIGRTPIAMSVWTVNDSNGTKLPITVINGSITVYDLTNPNDPNNPTNPNPPNPALQPTCSGSGRQTVNDAQCCLKMWVELMPQNSLMDLDQSGTVDSRDAVIVLQNVARSLIP